MESDNENPHFMPRSKPFLTLARLTGYYRLALPWFNVLCRKGKLFLTGGIVDVLFMLLG
jgi:hypothetical protein